jgi:hypothetical protein
VKSLIRLFLCSALIVLASSMALASPIITESGKFALYGAGNHFTGGDIDGNKLEDFNSGGMGFVVPIIKEISAGFQYGSTSASDDHYSLNGTLFAKDYLFRLNFDKCGSDGSITHLGVYRDFEAADIWHICMGGGMALINISGESKTTNNISMYADIQTRLQASDGGPFGYLGASYEYHLNAFYLEVGVGICL